ncbi:3-hydroxyacyl-CoA dehydrogenase NAD-binding domain-containing protein [Saprospiraceae bacterium]|nr:3-hydroxyacyl-CoA dehydrogenase NAD-binding domain-containing protein [Saprospiraceae bacterium]
MSNYTNEYLKYTVEDGIATITIDQTNQPTNLFSLKFTEVYYEAAKKAIDDTSVEGVIVTSGQAMFMAGGDLNELSRPVADRDVFFNAIMGVHKRMRELETAGKPFVAAINGTALGGGLELALTCHHRIAIDSTKIKIGLPESQVGLLPGGGGTSKLPYLTGIQEGLTLMLQGKELRPQDALSKNIINELATDQEDLMAKAKAYLKSKPTALQPWDNKKHRIPGGGLWSPTGVQTLMGVSGNVGKLTHGNYPAQKYIVSVVYEGIQIPIDRALEIEARYFTKIVDSPEAKNIIRTAFIGMQAAKKGKARPKSEPKYEIKKLGMLGAGMMGAGIAYVSAKAGMDVVLKDVTMEGAEKGKAYSKALLDKAISRKRSTPEKAEALLSKIKPTTDYNDFEGCDLVIEAVFEDPKLKDKVTKETEAVLAADKVFGSNTSTIPITQLAEASGRPDNFIGIHFFSPVDKMPLVEIIVGEKTKDKAIAAAVDYSVAIGKIPIVVNDSRGFFTSRCFSTYVSEGMFLLEEGVPAAMVENIAKKKGMPVGPLAVHDEVTMTLSMHIYESDPTPKQPYQERGYKIAKDMVENEKRPSKKDGAGFYDYPQGGKKKLWSKLDEKFKTNIDTLDEETIAKRLLHFQALESYRCLEEGVLRSTTDGDLGSVLGWGFPIYTGGSLSYIDYVGMKTFIAECDDFTKKYGVRFSVPDSLRKLSEAGKSIHQYGKAETKSAAEIKKMLEPALVEYANSIGIAAHVDDLKADTLKKVLDKLGHS